MGYSPEPRRPVPEGQVWGGARARGAKPAPIQMPQRVETVDGESLVVVSKTWRGDGSCVVEDEEGGLWVRAHGLRFRRMEE